MPQYQITSPEGKKYQVTAPPGTSADQALSYFQKNYKGDSPSTNSEDTSADAAAVRGLMAGVVGFPGDIQSAINAPFNAGMRAIGLGKYQAGNWPTPSQLENILPWKKAAELHPTAQTIGELAPMAFPAGLVVRGVAEAAKGSKVGQIASRVMPGATRRAEQIVETLGPAPTKDKLGSTLLSEIRPDYDVLYTERAKQLSRVAEMEDGPAKTAAFRKVYQDPRFSEIKKIEDSPLGSRVVATTNQYSSVPKLNPKTFANQAFKTPQDVRDLKKLLGGDQAKVERYASQYAASELKDVLANAKAGSSTEANPFKSEAGNVATALIKWRTANADWLNEVPQTKKLVDAFIDNMQKVAQTQKNMKYAAAAAATLGMVEQGFHPFSWVARLFGGVE